MKIEIVTPELGENKQLRVSLGFYELVITIINWKKTRKDFEKKKEEAKIFQK